MTLAELLPSMRTTLNAKLDRDLWSSGARADCAGELYVGDVPLSHIAGTHGTSCLVLDLDDIALRCRKYRQALPGVEIAYTARAFLCIEMARLTSAEGLSLTVCSTGELAAARRAGVRGSRIIMNGRIKTTEDLKAALSARVGRIVLESRDEIDALSELVRFRQDVLIRVDPNPDASIDAGRNSGFVVAPSELDDVVRAVRAHPCLRLVGLHCHLGSQITSTYPYELAAEQMVELLASVNARHRLALRQLNLGGGHGIRYRANDSALSLVDFANQVLPAVHRACRQHRIPVPALTVEPGRAIIGPSAVALYRVTAVRHRLDGHTYVAVDGAMNPNPLLDTAGYPVRMIGRPLNTLPRPVTVIGRHCLPAGQPTNEVHLPADVHAGDLLAVPMAGAYQQLISSAHTFTGRPPVIGIRDGHTQLLVRRETENELLARDQAQ